VLAILLLLECIAVTVFDIVSFAHPHEGSVSFAPLDPSNLFVTGFGAVMAMAIACFSGFESAAIYSEEAKDPRRTVARATYVAVAFTGAFYALSAWALSVVHGPENVQGVVAEQSAGAVFGPVAQYAGTLVADLANVLFITSVFAALLSFHNSVARYLFALGRERVMPKFLGRTGVKSAAPVAGSLVQTLAALIVVVLFTVTNRDPIADLFTWLSGIAAVGLVLLMTGTSVSVVGYFRRRQTDETVWRRAIAPTLAAILLAAVLFFLVFNFDALLAPTNPSYLKWLLPGLVGLAGVVGLIWGAALRSTRPDVYAGIGRSAVQPLSEEEEYVPVGV
jgi:amino acid transporter